MRKTKTLSICEYELPVKIERDAAGGYIATSPAWSDCYAQGDSVDEVMNEIISVAASLIEVYKEEGLEIPLQAKMSKSPIVSVPVFTTS